MSDGTFARAGKSLDYARWTGLTERAQGTAAFRAWPGAAYRYTLLPLIGPRCRHLPSCSDYAEQAIMRFGLWAGGWMALARILRCHPFGSHGLDFVPQSTPPGARWYCPGATDAGGGRTKAAHATKRSGRGRPGAATSR